MHRVHKVCRRFIAAAVIIVALALAIVVTVWKDQAINYIVNVSRFFDVMIPVLGAGALIKYLITTHNCHNHDHENGKHK
jgi:hypothetical protein